MPQPLADIAAAVLAVATVLVLLDQCRKPKGWLGRLILWTMNVRHSGVTDWGLKQVPLKKHFTILDVGCGGGRTLDKLAAVASEEKVFGIDYSAASVAAARRANARWIRAGRADIRQGSVSRLPYPDGTFDVVTAVETHYYWPDLAADLREVLRVLKPGGQLVMIAETYRGRPPGSADRRCRPSWPGSRPVGPSGGLKRSRPSAAFTKFTGTTPPTSAGTRTTSSPRPTRSTGSSPRSRT